MRFRAAFLAAAAASLSLTNASAEPTAGRLPGGARWAAEVPANWNGTLLLWSRGYSPKAGAPEIAPPGLAEPLLAQGYALAASNYGASGWALEEAVPAQLATLSAFAAAHGEPKRVVAWGNSMGGLVTTALAERRGTPIQGAIAFCASIGGATGMMNMALDGAYAFRTLVAPGSDIRIVDVDDDMANAKRVGVVVAAASATPQGRARLALVGVLAGIPGWTDPKATPPAQGDAEGQEKQMADAIVRGVFLPRVDQEQRAGGNFSWNRDVDYRRQLALSGRRALVESLYRAAGLDLDADLVRLNAGARIAAKPGAAAYMMAHYTPDARPAVPLLAVQSIGDGLTSPSMQQAYAEAAGPKAHALWVAKAGHCGFSAETVLSSLHYLEARLSSGHWSERPAGFVEHKPAPMLRPCFRRKACR